MSKRKGQRELDSVNVEETDVQQTSDDNTLVVSSKSNVANLESEVEKLRAMSLSEIGKYGVCIQQTLNENSQNVLKRTSMRELGATRESIEELSDITNKQSKTVALLKSPLRKIKHFQNNFKKTQSQIDEIQDKLVDQRDKLDNYIDNMVEQINNLSGTLVELRNCEDVLETYATELDTEDNLDQARLQEVSSRLRLISGTRVSAEQAQIQAYVILKEQQATKHQLDQVIQNVIPILSMQAVNSIGIDANKKTLDIINKTGEIVGKVIEQNAKDVKDMAVEIQGNRTKTVVSDEKIMSAQKLLNETLEIIDKASKSEAQDNLRLTSELKELAKDNAESIKKMKEMV